MKKASKVLTIILIAVMVCSIFAGCAMFGKNTQKYRQSTAFTVGNEKVTIGKVLDTFNSNYNTYAMYINAGMMTIDSLFENTVLSLYNQMEKIETYKNTEGVTVHSEQKDFCKDAEYLEKSELDFAVRYVKYMVYSTIDNLLEDYVNEDRTLSEKETADTSRDFTKVDDLRGSKTYAEYVYNQNLYNEEMDEYVKDYYDGLIKVDDFKADGYVYTSASQAEKRLADLNERLDKDDKELTYDELVTMQEKALKQYGKNVVSSYNFDLETLIKNQCEDIVASLLVAKYNFSINSKIEGENKADVVKVLKANYAQKQAAQTASFNTGKDFVSFVEGLTANDYVFSVPAGYNYIFVKNILIPFSENQKAVLKSLSNMLGDSSSDAYKSYREHLAASIAAEDFNSAKDEDGNRNKIKDVFVYENGKIKINPNGVLGEYFNADGTVTAMKDKTKDETVIELMKRFNTDTAQHTAAYDYVVRVGETPSDYKAKWVSEFVDAANEAWDNGNGQNNYALAVSEFGVHIVYYTKDVTAQTYDFDGNNYMDPTTVEYKMFKTYFEQQANILMTKTMNSIHEQYVKDGKITKTGNLDVFVKDNGFNFDFQKSLELDSDSDK